MKFKTDENLPVEVADLLQDAGYDAVTVFDQELTGEIDRTIAHVCQQEQRVLLTLDLDFADIRAYPRGSLQVSSCCAAGVRTNKWSLR